jgi:hypothetical protein
MAASDEAADRRRMPSAQDRAPLAWTNERADALFVCE